MTFTHNTHEVEYDRNHCCEYERIANMNEQEVAAKLTDVEARLCIICHMN